MNLKEKIAIIKSKKSEYKSKISIYDGVHTTTFTNNNKSYTKYVDQTKRTKAPIGVHARSKVDFSDFNNFFPDTVLEDSLERVLYALVRGEASCTGIHIAGKKSSYVGRGISARGMRRAADFLIQMGLEKHKGNVLQRVQNIYYFVEGSNPLFRSYIHSKVIEMQKANRIVDKKNSVAIANTEEEIKFLEDYQNFNLGLALNNHGKLVFAPVVRVSGDDFFTAGGGRIYSVVSNMTNVQRDELTMRGKQTVEYDIEKSQLNLAMMLLKINKVEVNMTRTEEVVGADGAKLIRNVCLFTKCIEDAIKAAWGKLYNTHTYEQVLDAMLCFLEDNKAILRVFFGGREFALKLQRLEADLTRHIIKKCMEVDLPVVSIHDSYRIPVDDSERFMELFKRESNNFLWDRIDNGNVWMLNIREK